jgi:hypothetical protein
MTDAEAPMTKEILMAGRGGRNYLEARNPKLEIRNKFEARMFECVTACGRSFEHSDFVLVSDFELGISDFLRRGTL